MGIEEKFYHYLGASSMSKPKNEAEQALNSDPAWWNRPVLGKGGLIDNIIHTKEALPEEAWAERKRHFSDIYIYAKTAEAIDSNQFIEPEFVSYIKIKYMLDQGLGEYTGLKQSYRYLQLAISLKDLLLFIDQTELRYRGYKQQEFYDQVADLLGQGNDAEDFKSKLEPLAESAIAQTKTPEGQDALRHYVNNLQEISDNPLGLDLLNRLKAAELSDLSVLVNIAEMIRNIEIRHIHDLGRLTGIANRNIATFNKISQIIQVPQNKNNTRSFAIMIQLVALNHQYESRAIKFEELVKVLRQWLKFYSLIMEINNTYPSADYQHPPEFSQPVPGEAVYRKYLNILTDQNQQICYYDLGQNAPLGK